MPPRLSPEFVREVQQLGHSEELQVLLDILVERYSESWRNTAPEQTATRDHLYRMVQAVEGLKNEIRSVSLDEFVEAHNRRLISNANWSNI